MDTSCTTLAVGDQVDQYRIVRMLGQGGIGWVYLAHDTQLGRKVAIKVLRADRVTSPEILLAEAQATARLNHPNIITIYSMGRVGDAPYLALEYLEGQSLRQRLKEERLALAEALTIVSAVTEAVTEAHRQGIIHRDIKPENIFLAQDGRVRVLDFGLAEFGLPPSGASTAILEPRRAEHRGADGTLGYMAPEQLSSGAPSPAADIWALGVVLFELIAGQRPFRTLQEVLYPTETRAHLQRLREAVPDLDHRLEQLVGDCLMVHPARRPLAAALSANLRALLASSAALPATVSPFRGLLPYQREHARWFAGREHETAALLELLDVSPVIAVVGPPGAGKTSLLLAGLAPTAVKAGYCDPLVLSPEVDPFPGLARQLLRTASVSLLSATEIELDELQQEQLLSERLARRPGLLGTLLRERAEAHQSRLLLLIDPLEPLLAPGPEAPWAASFFAAVLAAATPEGPVRVVLSLREASTELLAGHPTLASAVERHLFRLHVPTLEQLQTILTHPLELQGHHFDDPALIHEIATPLAGEVAALPLLQLVLERWWATRDPDHRLLRRAAYDELGGLPGLLAGHADSVVARLDPAATRVARALLLRLVTPTGTPTTARRAAIESELGATGLRVLEHLVDARLLLPLRDENGEVQVRLVHPALAVGWEQLRHWREEGRKLATPVARARPPSPRLTSDDVSAGTAGAPLISSGAVASGWSRNVRRGLYVSGIGLALLLIGLASALLLIRSNTTPAVAPPDGPPAPLIPDLVAPPATTGRLDQQEAQPSPDAGRTHTATGTADIAGLPDLAPPQPRVRPPTPGKKRWRPAQKPPPAKKPPRQTPEGWIIDPVIE